MHRQPAEVEALLLAQWYARSVLRLEEALGDHLSFRRFVGFSPHDDTPDHATISQFRRVLAQRGLVLKQGTLLDATGGPRVRRTPTPTGPPVGERQRVIVARALAQEPRLLLLDEPTANLDVHHQLQLLGLVRGLVDQGLTAVGAIHDLTLAARYCDRLVLLHEGRVLAAGTVAAVLTPANLARAFGVRAVVERDPWLGTLRVTVLGVLGEETARSHGS